MKSCPNCKAQIVDGAVFCTECGQKLSRVLKEEIPSQENLCTSDKVSGNFCLNCGAKYAQNVKFCTICGEPIREMADETGMTQSSQQSFTLCLKTAEGGFRDKVQKAALICLVAILICCFFSYEIGMRVTSFSFIAFGVCMIRLFFAKRAAGDDYKNNPAYKSISNITIAVGAVFIASFFIGACGLSRVNKDVEDTAIAYWEEGVKWTNHVEELSGGHVTSITRSSVKTLEKTDNTAVVEITYTGDKSSSKFTTTYHLQKQSDGKWKVIKGF